MTGKQCKGQKSSFPLRRETIAPQAVLIIQTMDSHLRGNDGKEERAERQSNSKKNRLQNKLFTN